MAKHCSRCNRKIKFTETPYMEDGHLLCPQCYSALQTEKRKREPDLMVVTLPAVEGRRVIRYFEAIFETSLTNLKHKAVKLGANAVIGATASDYDKWCGTPVVLEEIDS